MGYSISELFSSQVHCNKQELFQNSSIESCTNSKILEKIVPLDSFHVIMKCSISLESSGDVSYDKIKSCFNPRNCLFHSMNDFFSGLVKRGQIVSIVRQSFLIFVGLPLVTIFFQYIWWWPSILSTASTTSLPWSLPVKVVPFSHAAHHSPAGMFTRKPACFSCCCQVAATLWPVLLQRNSKFFVHMGRRLHLIS